MSPLHVLIVDDNPNTLSRLDRIARRACSDIKTFGFTTRDDAIKALRDRSTEFQVVIADLFLTDLHLGGEGEEVLVLTREFQPNAYRILVTTQFSQDWDGYNEQIVDDFVSLHYSERGYAGRLQAAVAEGLAKHGCNPVLPIGALVGT